jgi:chemotaxis signal transduction protein
MPERTPLATDEALFGRGGPGQALPARHHDFLLCRTGGALLATPLSAIREVGRVPARITRIPGAPAAILGLVKWRAAVFPAVDLSTHVGAPVPAGARARILIVVDLDDSSIGAVVDEMVGTCRVPDSAIVAQDEVPEWDGRLRVTGTLELSPERIDEGSHVPASFRERCRVPIVDPGATARELMDLIPRHFPGSRSE